VAKNVFLWPARSWLRKGLEAGFTVLIELTWPKRRIMEVYLNVAEFDAGVFGVQAAARHYWGIDAAEMGPQRAARLMAVLPDPKRRSPVSGTRFIQNRGAAIQRGAETIRADGRAACFL
jgi:monofunctional glycosyltransferase